MEQLPTPAADEQTRAAALRSLLEKSWNLELIISGAATFFTSQLPDWVERGFDFYLDNLARANDRESLMLPLLAYSFFKVVAWLLTGTFVAHLSMRAFWVSLIGLQAAFPAGIQWEKMPQATPVMRQFYAEKLGTLEGFLSRLDRRCNQVFAIAFAAAMMSAAIGLVYLFVFGAMQAVADNLSPAQQSTLRQALVYTLASIGLVILGATQWLKRRGKGSEKAERRLAQWSFAFGSVAMPLFRRAVFYVLNTFATNVPKRRYYAASILIGVFVMVGVMLVLLQKIAEIRHAPTLESRDFYTGGTVERQILADGYDGLRAHGRSALQVSIPSDMVEGPFLRVFLNYPKWLDQRLAERCGQQPVPPEILSKRARRAWQDSVRLACFGQFFQISVNDSLVRQPEFFFHQQPETGRLGLLTYLPTAGFRNGRNTLAVQIPAAARPDSLENFGLLPFWFAPK